MAGASSFSRSGTTNAKNVVSAAAAAAEAM